MKLKGITIFEQHAEKLVLAVFSVFLLVVLVMQVGLLGGNKGVKVGAKEVTLDGALKAVRDAALTRKASLESPNVLPELPEALPSPLERWNAALAKTEAPAPGPLAWAATPRLIGEQSDLGAAASASAAGDRRFAELTPEAPSTPQVAVYEGTIHPVEVTKVGSELASLLPAQQPYDVRALSVQATWNAEDLRSDLAGAGAPEGAQPVPAVLWQGRVELLDVEWMRQTRGSDGTWGEETLLPPPPGRDSKIRPLLSKSDFLPADFREVLEFERARRELVRRPPFYATIAGDAWTNPSALASQLDPARAETIEAKVRQHKGITDEAERLRRQIESIDGGPTKPTPPGGGPGGFPPPGGRQPPPPPGGGPDGNSPPKTPPAGGSPRSELPALPAARDQALASSASVGTPASEPEFQWPQFSPEIVAQFGGDGRGGERKPPDADQRREERERERLENLRKKLAEFETQLEDLATELADLGVAPDGKPLASTAQFAEPLDSILQPSLKSVTLWTHDLAAVPGQTYRYKARLRVTNPFYGNAERLIEEQRALAQAPSVLSAESDWSEPTSVEPSVVYFVTAATQPGGPLQSDAKASVEAFEFFYGYWRQARAQLQPGDTFAASAAVPEQFVTYPGMKSVAGKLELGDPSKTAAERVVQANVMLLDVASIPGASDRSLVYVRESEAGVLARRPADPAVQTVLQRLQGSAQRGQSGQLRPTDLPGGDGSSRPAGFPPPGFPGGGRQGGDDGSDSGSGDSRE